MGRRRKQQAVEEIAEEFCFVCKDSGDLRVCDYKNCLKVYHPRCVGKEDDFPDDQFICDWHKCVSCKRNSSYQCFCCPNSSVCDDCLGKVDFVQVKQHGFCNNCLKMAILVETNADAVFDGTMIDFSDKETISLFRDYWDAIKEKEGLTLIDLQAASINLEEGLNCKRRRYPKKVPDEDHKANGHLLGDKDDADQTFLFDTKDNPNEMQTAVKRRKSKKRTYVGWCSKELFEFLSCIGKDAAKPLDQFRISEIVKDYIKQKSLSQVKKKNNVVCDDKLHSLFRKRKLKYGRILSLIKIHLAENAASEDESLDDYEDVDGTVMKKKPRNSLGLKTPMRDSERYKGCFAALNQNNLKLIYLRRTLVMDLLSRPETFEQKVVDCLVRVKNDYKSYYYQMSKKPFQLVMVTGITKSLEKYKIKDTYTDILLCVSDVRGDVKISELSEEDFEEDECNDILLSVNKELFKRPTVAELEEKVASVHTDIVNHWLDKELKRLEREIERAHDKGWTKEMNDLMDRQKLLSTPAERCRRLEEVPEVTPDTELKNDSEFEVPPSKPIQKDRVATQQVVDSLEAAKEKSPGEPAGDSPGVVIDQSPEPAGDSPEAVIEQSPEGATEQVTHSLNVVKEESPDGGTTQPIAMEVHKDEKGSRHHNNGGDVVVIDLTDSDIDEDNNQDESLRPEQERGASGAPVSGITEIKWRASLGAAEAMNRNTARTAGPAPVAVSRRSAEDTAQWHYEDPTGESRGPFPMSLMRRWWANGYFGEDFVVWRTSQTKQQAILLTDAMRLTS